MSATSEEKAYFAPFALFLAFLGLNQFLANLTDGLVGAWWWSEPHFWIFPLQTAVCGWFLWKWRAHYELPRPTGLTFTTVAAVAVLLLWIAPQVWLGKEPRLEGFDPSYFKNGAGYWTTVVLRFVRLAVVVPLVEELFWRGFLLRILIAEPFKTVPVGAFSWLSFAVVTIGFTLEHQRADWPAAALAGAIYNLVAYRTRNLTSCVLAHALTNLLLGLYVMRTGQWGFW